MRLAAALIRGLGIRFAARHTSSTSRPFIHPANVSISAPLIRRAVATQSQSEPKSGGIDLCSQAQGIEIENKPWLMLSDPSRPELRFLYDLADGDVQHEFSLPSIAGLQCVGSSEGFIIAFDRLTEDILAVNPLTGAHLSIPSAAILPSLRPLGPKSANDDYIRRGKAILSPSLETVAIITLRSVACAAIGGSSWNLPPPVIDMFHDGIFHDGLFYAINDYGQMAVYDLDCPNAPVPFIFPQGAGIDETDYYTHLVKSPDGSDLFLIHRYADFSGKDEVGFTGRTFSSRFLLFKLNKDDYSWHEVASVGDLALFVGANHSFALRAPDFSGIEANSVYFTNYPAKKSARQTDINMRTFAGVYDLGKKSIKFFNLYDGLCREDNKYVPIWFMPSRRLL